MKTFQATEISARVQLQTDRIRAEVHRAIELHAPMNSLHEAHSVILEEFEEFWDEVKMNPKKLAPEEQKDRIRRMQAELLQVAAMCVRATIDCDLMG